MKLVFAIIILIHGIIHLMGFVKAFQLADINPVTQSISKPLGMLWLFTALFFVIAAVLFYLKIEWWFVLAFIAIFISQTLIIIYWKESKFGTLANIIILIPAILGLATYNFETAFFEMILLLALPRAITSPLMMLLFAV